VTDSRKTRNAWIAEISDLGLKLHKALTECQQAYDHWHDCVKSFRSAPDPYYKPEEYKKAKAALNKADQRVISARQEVTYRLNVNSRWLETISFGVSKGSASAFHVSLGPDIRRFRTESDFVAEIGCHHRAFFADVYDYLTTIQREATEKLYSLQSIASRVDDRDHNEGEVLNEKLSPQGARKYQSAGSARIGDPFLYFTNERSGPLIAPLDYGEESRKR
jgi:hypothetical protein